MISTEEALGRPGLPAVATLSYGGHPAQVGELRLPEAPGPHPVAVVIHGGCWRALADRGYVQGLAADLATHGWATWTLEFRRVDQPGGAWPGIFRDVAAGADHVGHLSSRWPLDPERAVVVGHSSGAHLALWLAARHRLPPDAELASSDPLSVRAAVSLGGIADLEHFRSLSRRGCRGAVGALMGARPGETPERWDQADPGRLLPLGVPQLLVHGAEDPDVPVSHARAWATRARAAGDAVTLEVLPGAGHFEVVAPWWEGWSGVRRRLLDFLETVVPAVGS